MTDFSSKAFHVAYVLFVVCYHRVRLCLPTMLVVWLHLMQTKMTGLVHGNGNALCLFSDDCFY